MFKLLERKGDLCKSDSRTFYPAEKMRDTLPFIVFNSFERKRIFGHDIRLECENDCFISFFMGWFWKIRLFEGGILPQVYGSSQHITL